VGAAAWLSWGWGRVHCLGLAEAVHHACPCQLESERLACSASHYPSTHPQAVPGCASQPLLRVRSLRPPPPSSSARHAGPDAVPCWWVVRVAVEGVRARLEIMHTTSHSFTTRMNPHATPHPTPTLTAKAGSPAHLEQHIQVYMQELGAALLAGAVGLDWRECCFQQLQGLVALNLGLALILTPTPTPYLSTPHTSPPPCTPQRLRTGC